MPLISYKLRTPPMPARNVFLIAFFNALLALSLGPSHALAQTERTSLTGIVVDPQGNRIPQAKVIAVQEATGLTRETETTSQGTYLLGNLPKGVFTIRFSKSGFSVYQASNIRLIVGQTGTLDVKLSLGAKQEEATINESIVQLDK